MNGNTDRTSATPALQGVGISKSRRTLRLATLIPVLVFTVVVLFLALGLERNPRNLPSPLVGRPVPEFDLPAVRGRTLGLASRDLRGEVALVNVFASWCVACRDEHPLLVDLARSGTVAVHGLNYKDRPEDASAWLDALGDPYTRTGADIDGRVGIDWGVYGVPETFLIDQQGRIVFKQVGPISPAILEEQILPRARMLTARPESTSPVENPTGGPTDRRIQ